MSWTIKDTNEYQITIDNGWQTWIAPKFRIFMEVDGDFLFITWNQRERGGDNFQLAIDYNDVNCGSYTDLPDCPSSAEDLMAMIDAMIVSGFDGGGGGGGGDGHGLHITSVNYALDPATVGIVQCNAGGITITLEPASDHTEGKVYIIKDASRNAGTNNILITPDASDNFEGLSTGQSLLIADDGKAIHFYSDMANTFYLV